MSYDFVWRYDMTSSLFAALLATVFIAQTPPVISPVSEIVDPTAKVGTLVAIIYLIAKDRKVSKIITEPGNGKRCIQHGEEISAIKAHMEHQQRQTEQMLSELHDIKSAVFKWPGGESKHRG